MESIVYDVWLSQALPYGSAKIKIVKEMYGSIDNFYQGGEYEWRLCGHFTSKDILKLKNESLDSAKQNVSLAYKLGYKIIPLFDKDYPKLLEEIYNPPGVIYVSGETEVLNSGHLISIVGTRKALEVSKQAAYKISRDLAFSGITVVSGGAVGIDSAAHKGALSCGGKTILVLGCGINYPYLMYNKRLRDEISQNGAVISEFPPNYPCNRYTFPIRNRIIAGISRGTVIIEAGEKSGSLITANCACEQNRDVFVLNSGNMYALPKGSKSLADDGAKIIKNAKDILDEYGFIINEDPEIKALENSNEDKDTYAKDYYQENSLPEEILLSEKKSLDSQEKSYNEPQHNEKSFEIPEHLREVYNEISKGKIHIDVLSAKVRMPISKLLPIITELELLGFIKAESGRTYSAI